VAVALGGTSGFLWTLWERAACSLSVLTFSSCFPLPHLQIVVFFLWTFRERAVLALAVIIFLFSCSYLKFVPCC